MKVYFKMNLFLLIIIMLLIKVNDSTAQNVVHPTSIKKPVGFAISGPLRNNPVVSYLDFPPEEIPINRKINTEILPPDYSKMLPDIDEQSQPGSETDVLGIINNYAGQNTNYNPPDASGDVGENYYFQVVNVTYAIYDKSDGSIVAGPSPLNSIFNSSLPGAGFNNGDPIVLWDEQANRWFYTEFSIGTPPLYPENDYILIAVSQTNDPTGSWYSWSFDVDDIPDYPKFGIWKDGYYMATNTPNGDDVYVFDREAMIAGNPNPTMIGFDNPNRPSTFDGFHGILPLDNDGPWAPAGTPGQFITIADDGQGNPSDALWIYELDVDWSTPSNSTFARTQTLNVNSFSGNFNGTWNNIPQPGTSQKLDGISTVLMHRAQYRNFSGTQSIVCNHTIAESGNEAAIRWYELENTGSSWYIAQQGTYNPDNVSRWMASIAMNDIGEIAMGYSVSDGSSTYPGIRYCGRSNYAPPNTMDIAETTIWTGNYSQTSSNRWGDYSNISIDPGDGNTFWFTSQYKESATHTKGTRIAAFSISSGIQVVVDQKRESGQLMTGTQVGRWEGGPDFVNYTVPIPPFTFQTGFSEVLRGLQDFVTNPYEKYNRWIIDFFDEPDVRNHHIITITSDISNLTSQFKNTYSGITAKNKLVEVNNIDAGKLKFKDPWFINYNDPTNYQDQYGFRNLGSDAISEWVNTPFNPNTGTGAGSEYKGVFLNQPIISGKPYYSIDSAPHDVELTQTGRTHRFYWRSWEYDPSKVDLASPNYHSTNVVFLSDNATITANVKGTQLSNINTAYDYNSQRKFLRTDNGHLHNVYISLGALWYERSTDGGANWEIIGGQPINSDNPKQVSIDYLGSGLVLIAFQHQTTAGSKVVIYIYINGAPKPGTFKYDVVSFGHDPSEYDERNAEPVIAVTQAKDFFIVYKVLGILPKGAGDDPTIAGLYYSFGELDTFNDIQWYSSPKWKLIPTTYVNSIHPTICADIYSSNNYFHIAYQENNQIKYYYRKGQAGSGSLDPASDPVNISATTGFSEHYNPSIIAMGNGARVCWTGYRIIYKYEQYKIDGVQTGGSTPQYKVVFRDPDNTSRAWQFGRNVSSPNFNKQNDNTYYAFAWSENLSQIKFADNSLSTVRTIDNVTGQKPQMSNGPDKNNMYCMSYEYNSGVPYYFTMSDDLGSYYQFPKTNYFAFTSGREGILSIDGAEFYFSLGDIRVDGQPIDFIEIADSVSVNNLSTLNEYMVTDPINISDNSDFIYSVQYGINDSLSASQAILEDMLINFKVMLIDNSTGEIIGIHDDVTYDSENIYQYNNISYRVNTEGIGNRSVRLKLLVEDNFTPVYSLSKIYSDESVLGKTTLKEINYQGSGVITTYDLSQNYPNPFNPTTTIRYQLPESGKVNLIIYDILGREVTTLVNDFKTEGRYEATFNTSSLASGVYLYRLNVNDYVDVKKMILLK